MHRSILFWFGLLTSLLLLGAWLDGGGRSLYWVWRTSLDSYFSISSESGAVSIQKVREFPGPWPRTLAGFRTSELMTWELRFGRTSFGRGGLVLYADGGTWGFSATTHESVGLSIPYWLILLLFLPLWWMALRWRARRITAAADASQVLASP